MSSQSFKTSDAEKLAESLSASAQEASPGNALSKLFFLQLLEHDYNLNARLAERAGIAGSRTKETQNERVYTPKKQDICA